MRVRINRIHRAIRVSPGFSGCVQSDGHPIRLCKLQQGPCDVSQQSGRSASRAVAADQVCIDDDVVQVVTGRPVELTDAGDQP